MGWSAEKRERRAQHRRRHATPNPLTTRIINGYKTAKVPRYRWDLTAHIQHKVHHPVVWINSNRAIREFYRMQAKILGGKHTRSPYKRHLRKQTLMDKDALEEVKDRLDYEPSME